MTMQRMSSTIAQKLTFIAELARRKVRAGVINGHNKVETVVSETEYAVSAFAT